MRILYMADRHDYGDPQRGESYEHANFYDALVRMGHDVIYFDPSEIARLIGKDAMNQRLLDVVKAEQPTLLFGVAYEGLNDPATLREISENTDTKTLNWFCDDHWRFESFSRHWAPCFNWVVTTSEAALPRYATLGFRNVIKSQWACNPGLYRDLQLPLIHEVTFVGMKYGRREKSLNALRRAGIRVRAWGSGWPVGRLTTPRMIEVFQQSRINLNFTEASTSGAGVKAKRFWNGPVQNILNHVPGGWRVNAAGREALTSLVHRVNSPPHQIKGRVFEVPACGGFLMTGAAENLRDYYTPEREAAVFCDDDELVEKTRHYLANEEERAAIARAGHERTLREHTYTKRFEDIFRHIGLMPATLDATAKAA